MIVSRDIVSDGDGSVFGVFDTSGVCKAGKGWIAVNAEHLDWSKTEQSNNNKCGLYTIYENLILNQGCSQAYNNNENIHVDNNKIITLEIVLENGVMINNED